ncbi:PepSY domain-containing protein [Ammoniphilus sp. CFH 90114]|uniref:PepSY-associated TM helix domain-containing protein n=1 Tax=Ammoniphilus sp. CFH 90114 TaxID=2493665 RepID=UPI00100EAE33|nr:PepSY domain-containing protein [Ammoniphilus sp. CFH 90114]RXT07882.1 PepSY domain-containing protein [Ammoniphilus sp. CFH 90114]
MKKQESSFYQIIWRWHFYAGLIFAPFIFILAVTGSVYLFKPQIEQWMYKDYYHVEQQHHKMLPSGQIEAVRQQYPEAQVTKYRPGESSTRSAEVKINMHGESLTVFVDPYTGEIMGELNDKNRLIDRIEEFHGELMLGTVGDRIVELTACWTIILIVTGIYLWSPKGKRTIAGVLIPRFSSGRKNLIRDLHVVPGFWLSAAILFLVITGLLWSGLWGTKVQYFATNAGVGYPPSVWVGSAPTTIVKTKEIADVPWAAQNLDVPQSQLQGYIPLSIDDVVTITNGQNIHPTYTVIFPKKPEGVYTISVFPPRARDEATLHIDQYTGAILADYRYDHYQQIGKLMAWGITVHKGLEYGLPNQILGLIVCIGIVGLVVSGFILWWKRKPIGHLGAPKSPGLKKIKGLVVILTLFGIAFPLVGVSLVFVYVLDRFVIQRVDRLKRVFNA